MKTVKKEPRSIECLKYTDMTKEELIRKIQSEKTLNQNFAENMFTQLSTIERNYKSQSAIVSTLKSNNMNLKNRVNTLKRTLSSALRSYSETLMGDVMDTDFGGPLSPPIGESENCKESVPYSVGHGIDKDMLKAVVEKKMSSILLNSFLPSEKKR